MVDVVEVVSKSEISGIVCSALYSNQCSINILLFSEQALRAHISSDKLNVVDRSPHVFHSSYLINSSFTHTSLIVSIFIHAEIRYSLSN